MTSVHTSAQEQAARTVARPEHARAGGGVPEPPEQPIAWSMLSRALSVPLILGLVCFLPAVIAAQPGVEVRDTAYWLQLVLTCYAGARLATMILSTRRRLLQGVFWMFVYIAMGVAPFAQVVIGQTPTPMVGPRQDLVTAIAMVLVGCAAYDLGALLASRRPLRRRTVSVRSWGPALAHPVRLRLLVLVAFAASAFYVLKLGGPAVFFSSRQEINETVAATGVAAEGSNVGSAFLKGFGQVPALLALLLYTRRLATSYRARRTPSTVLVWVALGALNLVVNNPISNARYWFLTVLMAFVFTALPSSAAVYRTVLATGVVGALVVFPYADKFRYDDEAQRSAQSASVFEPLVTKDYDQMVMFANTISWVDTREHTYGRQLAGSALFFVPRAVWSGKPEDTGVRVGQWMGLRMTNLSAPLWTEFWVDFGASGMIGGLALIGYAAARTDRRYALAVTRAGPGPGSVLAIAAPLIAGYTFILLRGPLLQAAGKLAIAALCLVLITTFREQRAARRR
ncbi:MULTISPECIES: hypothetical protein [Streptomyces]|uniref:Oligosaccharide repeat unit polymerase n=1 Tax=Streptomyces glycanivorans TaxID=3033808 RepID=A0ABY9J9M1_9ACTN|nr:MULTISPECIES: hypothetical protein [unclassified Streptomyces]WSQ76900.1 hypothetical protein OG725_07270 [Streptomyces sp. NBC_01213]TXS19909.1 hypothetical protein EAO68_00990 [Streptomyces sp. wa22]WLQ63519.1 hypothetical protein P8A20_07935 [Streptomyces sp. Alt3]WSQ84228.1 hypothetical protein OG722_07700 [Streptomyces sp. NBC_01212]WSR09715.1 hypothetical protein OG265_28465 [Streptomyces sp. NBC_01208]